MGWRPPPWVASAKTATGRQHCCYHCCSYSSQCLDTDTIAAPAELRDVFIKTLDDSSTGVVALMGRLSAYLAEVDPLLARALEDMKLMPQFYAFRWMTLLLSQEFQLPDVRVVMPHLSLNRLPALHPIALSRFSRQLLEFVFLALVI